MKCKCLIISLLLVCSALLTGCDFVRSALGRPTSADIDAKRQLILEENRVAAEEKAKAEAAEKYSRDSLAALNSFADKGIQMKLRSELPATIVSAPELRYYIIAGAFGTPSNAEKLQSNLVEKGFNSEILVYRSGIRAVGVTPTDDIVELYGSYDRLVGEKIIPADAWILVNE